MELSIRRFDTAGKSGVVDPKQFERSARLYNEADKLLKDAESLGSNSRDAANANRRAAYIDVMCVMANLPSLAKRAAGRVDCRKALEANGLNKAKAKRLAEQSAKFLIKFGASAPDFIISAKKSETGLMEKRMADAKLVNEADILKFNRDEKKPQSLGEAFTGKLSALQKKKAYGEVADAAELVMNWLAVHGYINGVAGSAPDAVPSDADTDLFEAGDDDGFDVTETDDKE